MEKLLQQLVLLRICEFFLLFEVDRVDYQDAVQERVVERFPEHDVLARATQAESFSLNVREGHRHLSSVNKIGYFL